MNCSVCNKAVPDDFSFCPYCGTKIDHFRSSAPTPVVTSCCAQCGHQLPEGSVFCTSCGARFSGISAEIVDMSSSANLPKKRKRSKKVLVCILLSVLLIATIGVAVWFFVFNRAPNCVVYFGEDGLVYDNLSGTSIILSDEKSTNHCSPQISKNGDKLFYLADDDLYFCNVKHFSPEPTRLDKDVFRFFAAKDGSHVFYTAFNAGGVSLYWCDTKGNGEQIAECICYINLECAFATEDGNAFFYTAMSEKNLALSDTATLYKAYFVGNRLETEKIAKRAILLCASPDGEQIAYDKDRSLYIKSGKDEPVLVSSEYTRMLYLCNDLMCYYLKNNSVYFFDGKTSHKLLDSFWHLDWPKYVGEPVVFHYTLEGECVIIIQNQVYDNFLKDVHSVSIREDGKEALVLIGTEPGNYDAYTVSTEKTLGNPKKVMEDVYSACYTENGKHRIYKTNYQNELYTLYVDERRIADDVHNWDCDYDSDIILYTTDFVSYADASIRSTYSLWVVDSSKHRQIGKLVSNYEFTPGGAITFLCDCDVSSGSLYYYSNNKVIHLADDVSALYSVRYGN